MQSDEALFERLQQGDIGAFDVLYERYKRPLFGFIRQYTTDVSLAEEIFHEAFVAVLDAGKAGPGITSFRTWLYRVTRNRCLNQLRGHQRGARAIADIDQHPEPTAASADDLLINRETAVMLRDAVSRLPQHLGEVYRLRANGMSYEESAVVLGIPVGTVRSRIHAMVSRLRKEMER